MTDEQAELRRVAKQLRAAREHLRKAMDAAQYAAEDAHAEGVPETEIARTLRVNRMTVRRWLGKL